MEDIIDIIVTETTNTIEITAQPNDEIIDVNIIDNREDIVLNVTPTVVEININSLTSNFGVKWGDITGTLADQTDLNNALALKANLVGGKVPASELPSYVDDVVEVATFSALPATGEIGKIYVILDTNKIYRWSGSVYVEIADSTAVWGAITGTLSNQTDLQNALDAKQDDLNGTGFVKASGTTISYDNSTYLTTSAATSTYLALAGGTMTGAIVGTTSTFAMSGSGIGLGVNLSGASGDGIKITHSAGRALNIQSSGGGYGILINNETASTSAPFTIQKQGASVITLTDAGAGTFNSSLTASSFVKTSGTSAQFLKADGSVDSSTYAKRSGLTDSYLPAWSSSLLGGSLTDSFIRYISNITYVEGMGLSTLNGLDITGAYSGGSAGLKIRSYDETTGNAYIDFASTGGRMYLGLNRSTASGLMTNATAYATVLTTGLGTTNLEFGTNLTKRMTIDGTTGAVTLTGALSGTSATFSSTVNAQGGLLLTTTQTITTAGSIGYNSTVGTFINSKAGSSFDFRLYNGVGVTVMTIPTSTQSAIFSSSVALDGGDFRYRPNGDVTNSPALVLKSPTAGVLSICAEVIGDANAASNSLSLRVSNVTSGRFDALTIASTGAATFSSSVTATSGIFSAVTSINIGAVGGNVFTVDKSTGGNIAFYANGVYSGQIDATTSGSLNIASRGTYPAITILTGGSVGIGTTSPTAKLHVAGASSAVLIGESSGVAYITGTNAAGTSSQELSLRGFPLTFTGNGGGGAEAMRITSGGHVLINRTTLATPSLSANGTLQVNNEIITTGSNAGLFWENRSGGVTTTSNWYGWYTSAGTIFLYNGSTNIASINSGNGIYTPLSDRNKKKDFEDSAIGLNEVMQLKPTLYRMKSESEDSEKQLGFIAQEVQGIIPSAYQESGDFIGLNYNPIVAALTKAVQELKAELDTLKNK